MILNRLFFIWIAFFSLLLGACSTLEQLSNAAATDAAGSITPPVQITETPTIEWFPATATPSPQPFLTHTPTPEMHPGVGPDLLHDTFSEAELWDTAVSDKGSATLDRNRLTLVVQPRVYLISLRHQLALSDFYVEITARLNLCRGEDDYGVLLRANAVAYYRFGLSCNGSVRAERISVDTRQILQDSMMSGDAPRGSPGEVRIGVWAAGTEMRLFLNGRYQFTVNNPNYRTGTIGVFARSAGDTPLTVNFSDLVIQAVEYSPPTSIPVQP